jgi:multisubunit Na+/H+ antiporter MnhG subunit
MERSGGSGGGRLMEIMGVIIAIVAAFLVFRFITGMIKFVVLALILLAVFYFMTGGFGA